MKPGVAGAKHRIWSQGLNIEAVVKAKHRTWSQGLNIERGVRG